VSEIKLVNRDYQIFREIDRWRVVLGRHITALAGFTGQKACDRRLRKLRASHPHTTARIARLEAKLEPEQE
jgi:hypothetical protein